MDSGGEGGGEGMGKGECGEEGQMGVQKSTNPKNQISKNTKLKKMK